MSRKRAHSQPPRPQLLILVTELAMGGAARVVRDHAQAFAERYDVTEAVFNAAADGVDFPGRAPPVSLDVGGGGGPVTKLLNFARRVGRLRALKRRTGTAVAISHLEGAHYVNVLGCAGETTILCVHGTTLHDLSIRGMAGKLRRRVLIPRLYNRADRIVTVSRDLVPELVSMGVDAARILTINNFFEVERIAERSLEPLPPEEQPLFERGDTLVAAGRLAEQKNQASLLDMLVGLRRERPVKLIIVGDGPLRRQLIDRAKGLGLASWDCWSGRPIADDRDVYFVGAKENPFPYMRAASLFLLPSAFEGFPLALGEAMICGAAVLATDCATGPREMLAPDTATPAEPLRTAESAPFGMLMPLLHEPRSRAAGVEIWSDTIRRLLDDAPERERLGAAAAVRMEDFRKEKIVGQWFELIDSLLMKN